jgi:hypothetical protein
VPTYRTDGCHRHGHRELTIHLADAPPIPRLERVLLDFVEERVARGATFAPGQTVQLGWSTLRVCERADGTLGLEERELSPRPAWVEQVDRALLDVWRQKEVAASVGLELAFPRQDESFLLAGCAADAASVAMTRLPDEDLPDGFSGWSVVCTARHEHTDSDALPLLALAAMRPALVQLLALPHGTVALAVAGDDARVRPYVFRDGAELAPAAGSYLAALQR